MPRKELWVPLAVVGLTVAFALVSLLVRYSRGNPWLIRRKLRIGAVLLGLTWAASGCTEEEVTCYAPILPDPQDEIEFDGTDVETDHLQLDISTGNRITGTVRFRHSDSFVYRLLAESAEEVQRGEVVAADGEYDEEEEAIWLDVDAATEPATYELLIYAPEIEGGEVVGHQILDVVPGR